MSLQPVLQIAHMPEITMVDVCLIMDRLEHEAVTGPLSDFFHEAELGAKADYLATIGKLMRERHEADELQAERQRRLIELSKSAEQQSARLVEAQSEVTTITAESSGWIQVQPSGQDYEPVEPPEKLPTKTFNEILDDLVQQVRERMGTMAVESIEDDDGETD